MGLLQCWFCQFNKTWIKLNWLKLYSVILVYYMFPGVSPWRGLLIPHGYLHPGKCEQSAKCKVIVFVIDRFVVSRMRESSLISKIWRTIIKSERTQNCQKTSEKAKTGKRRDELLPQDHKRLLRRDKCWKIKTEERRETTMDWNRKQVCWYIVCTELLRIYMDKSPA